MSPSSRRPARPPRRPRNSLTPDAILDAAEVVAARGLDELTVRALATELSSSPMALYRYFATKDELVDALLDRVLGRFDLPAPSGDWLADLGAFAHAHRALLVAHPWAVPVLFSHPSPGINATAIGEAALAILDRGGVRGMRAVAVFSAVLALNYGWCAFALARDPERPVDERAPDISALLASLPVAQFPLTVAVAPEMADYGSDEQYALALGLLVNGIPATGEWDAVAR